MVALNLKRREEDMEWEKVLGLGPGKALGAGEGRKPGCRKGLFTERSGENGWKGRVGSKSHGLECYVKELDFIL